MKEQLQEIYDGLQERLKSPFLVTFVLVWSIQHWRLIFILLTFDSDLNQGHKIEAAEIYISKHSGWCGMILTPLIWSIASIIFYYLMTILTKTIGVGYNRGLALTYLKLNEKRKLITKEEHKEVEGKLKRQQSRIEELQKRVIEVSASLKDEENKYSSLLAAKSTIEQQNQGLNDTIRQANENITTEIKKSQELTKELNQTKQTIKELQIRTEKDLKTIEDLKAENKKLKPDKKEINPVVINIPTEKTKGLAEALRNGITSEHSFRMKFFVDKELHIKKVMNNNEIEDLIYTGDDTFISSTNSSKYVFTDIQYMSPNKIKVTFNHFTTKTHYKTYTVELTYRGKNFYGTRGDADLIFMPK